MRLNTVLLGVAGAALAAAPIVAQAAGAERAAAAVDGENALGYPDSGTQLIVLALVAAAIVGGIALFDGDDEPSSP